MLKYFLISLLVLKFTLPSFAETKSEDKGWTTWVSLGGEINSDPAACTTGDLTYVFARGLDNQIWYRKRYLPTGVWEDWKRMPIIYYGNQQISVSGSPAASCAQGPYRTLIVNVVGSDNRLWTISAGVTPTYDGWGTWGQFAGFNAASFSGPALAGWTESNRLHYFVRGGDNRMYMKTSFNTTSTPFQVLVSERSYNDPAAVMPSPDRLDFFYRDQYGRLWQQFMFGDQWYPRQRVYGTTYSSPDVVSRNIYTLDLFAKGYNNTLKHKRSVNGVWGSWINLGGSVASGPGATTYANNARIFVFVRWTDGTLRYKAWAP